MDVKQSLAVWDEKSADDIREIYESHFEELNFIDSIVKLSKIKTFQKGSTWLLKAWLEGGNRLDADQINKVYSLLDQLYHWEAKLHILQSIAFMPIERSDIQHVEKFLRLTLIDTNKFVRAWSYSGFHDLATQYPEYCTEVKQLFEMAMRDEAPSIKARIRSIMKKAF